MHGMCEAFEEGVRMARETHTPTLVSCRRSHTAARALHIGQP